MYSSSGLAHYCLKCNLVTNYKLVMSNYFNYKFMQLLLVFPIKMINTSITVLWSQLTLTPLVVVKQRSTVCPLAADFWQRTCLFVHESPQSAIFLFMFLLQVGIKILTVVAQRTSCGGKRTQVAHCRGEDRLGAQPSVYYVLIITVESNTDWSLSSIHLLFITCHQYCVGHIWRRVESKIVESLYCWTRAAQ